MKLFIASPFLLLRKLTDKKINQVALILFLTLSIILVAEGNPIGGENCRISTNRDKRYRKNRQPLILSDNSEQTFLWPDHDKNLRLSQSTSILLACPGRNNTLRVFGTKWVTANCSGGTHFLVNSKDYEFSEFQCSFSVSEEVTKSSQLCLRNHQLYGIGFTVKNKSIPLIEVCRDDRTLETFYSKYTIVKQIDGRQNSVSRPSWKRGPFYPTFVDTMYRKINQIKTLTLLLGSEKLAEKYITKEQFLNRGHLASKADFVNEPDQRATFWVINTAPQWSKFNAGNWATLEANIRDFAIDRNMDLTVYCGVHGQTTLPDINGNNVPLYLFKNETRKEIPIPRFFWKIIQDSVNKSGAVFIGLNEPYAEVIEKDMYLCPDIGHDPAFSWLTWKPKEISIGVSYVCSIGDFLKVVKNVPDDVKDFGVLR